MHNYPYILVMFQALLDEANETNCDVWTFMFRIMFLCIDKKFCYFYLFLAQNKKLHCIVYNIV